MAKKIVPIAPGQVTLQRHSYRLFNAYVPGDVTKADLTDPRLWSHIASNVLPGDEIRVLAEDMSFRAHLLILYKQGSEISPKVIQFDKFAEEDKKGMDAGENGYIVKWQGPSHKWSIITPDGEKLKTGLQSKKQAEQDLADHLKALAR
ncbi:MAG: hypothetical protein AAFZ74_02115 [Pseudomonadota bacterium]